MPSKKRNMYLEGAAVCGPLAVLGAAHFLFSPPPPAPDPSGTGGLIPANLPVAAARVLTPEQAKATEWARALPSGVVLSSPMDHPDLVAPAPPAQVPDPEPVITEPDPTPAIATAPALSPLTGLRLTAVVGNAQGGLAMIGGRVYRVGDTVRAGATLTGIDIGAGTVECTLSDGTIQILKRPE
jgi:hypothetical protein